MEMDNGPPMVRQPCHEVYDMKCTSQKTHMLRNMYDPRLANFKCENGPSNADRKTNPAANHLGLELVQPISTYISYGHKINLHLSSPQ